jgi:hypothetical protein
MLLRLPLQYMAPSPCGSAKPAENLFFEIEYRYGLKFR